MHEQITIGFAERKYLNQCSPFGYVSQQEVTSSGNHSQVCGMIVFKDNTYLMNTELICVKLTLRYVLTDTAAVLDKQVLSTKMSCANLYANRTKMEAGDCPTLSMNAMENYLLSHSLKCSDVCAKLSVSLHLKSFFKKHHAASLDIWVISQLMDMHWLDCSQVNQKWPLICHLFSI